MRFLFASGLFWISAACCAVAQIFIVTSVVRGTRRTPLEVFWAVLPAAVLSLVLLFTWRAIELRHRVVPSSAAQASA